MCIGLTDICMHAVHDKTCKCNCTCICLCIYKVVFLATQPGFSQLSQLYNNAYCQLRMHTHNWKVPWWTALLPACNATEAQLAQPQNGLQMGSRGDPNAGSPAMPEPPKSRMLLGSTNVTPFFRQNSHGQPRILWLHWDDVEVHSPPAIPQAHDNSTCSPDISWPVRAIAIKDEAICYQQPPVLQS